VREFLDFAQIFLFVSVLMSFWVVSNVQKLSIELGRPPGVAGRWNRPWFGLWNPNYMGHFWKFYRMRENVIGWKK